MLIAVGVILAAGLFLLLWFAVAFLLRRRFQFGLRSLLATVLVVAVACSWFAVELERARRQREVVDLVFCELGGLLLLDRHFDDVTIPPAPPGVSRQERHEIGGPFGDEFFHDITYVLLFGTAASDEHLEQIAQLDKLEVLTLAGTKVTDTGIHHLRSVRGLRFLDLRATQVTPEGVKRLQEALPECEIVY